MTWDTGRSEIAAALERGELESITGDAANGAFLLGQARLRLDSARTILDTDPVGAFEFAYESVRHTATALLLQQGLRPTSDGGHIAICRAVSAQFGGAFDFLNHLRILRNALEYPRGPGSLDIQASVMAKALDYAEDTLQRSTLLLEELTIWR